MLHGNEIHVASSSSACIFYPWVWLEGIKGVGLVNTTEKPRLTKKKSGNLRSVFFFFFK